MNSFDTLWPIPKPQFHPLDLSQEGQRLESSPRKWDAPSRTMMGGLGRALVGVDKCVRGGYGGICGLGEGVPAPLGVGFSCVGAQGATGASRLVVAGRVVCGGWVLREGEGPGCALLSFNLIYNNIFLYI